MSEEKKDRTVWLTWVDFGVLAVMGFGFMSRSEAARSSWLLTIFAILATASIIGMIVSKSFFIDIAIIVVGLAITFLVFGGWEFVWKTEIPRQTTTETEPSTTEGLVNQGSPVVSPTTAQVVEEEIQQEPTENNGLSVADFFKARQEARKKSENPNCDWDNFPDFCLQVEQQNGFHPNQNGLPKLSSFRWPKWENIWPYIVLVICMTPAIYKYEINGENGKLWYMLGPIFYCALTLTPIPGGMGVGLVVLLLFPALLFKLVARSVALTVGKALKSNLAFMIVFALFLTPTVIAPMMGPSIIVSWVGAFGYSTREYLAFASMATTVGVPLFSRIFS